jgi:hypothetical protein
METAKARDLTPTKPGKYEIICMKKFFINHRKGDGRGARGRNRGRGRDADDAQGSSPPPGGHVFSTAPCFSRSPSRASGWRIRRGGSRACPGFRRRQEAPWLGPALARWRRATWPAAITYFAGLPFAPLGTRRRHCAPRHGMPRLHGGSAASVPRGIPPPSVSFCLRLSRPGLPGLNILL